MKESEIEFFRPLGRRIAITAFCFIWSLVEWGSGESFWGTMTAALFLFCAWKLHFTFDQEIEKLEISKKEAEAKESEKDTPAAKASKD
jgi:hypothetical protein